MAPTYCCVPGCFVNSKDDTIVSFFSFPLDDRCYQWVKSCGRHDLLPKTPTQLKKSYRVCGMHFEDNMFSSISMSRLKKTAVPTVFTSCCNITEVSSNVPSNISTSSSSFRSNLSTPDSCVTSSAINHDSGQNIMSKGNITQMSSSNVHSNTTTSSRFCSSLSTPDSFSNKHDSKQQIMSKGKVPSSNEHSNTTISSRFSNSLSTPDSSAIKRDNRRHIMSKEIVKSPNNIEYTLPVADSSSSQSIRLHQKKKKPRQTLNKIKSENRKLKKEIEFYKRYMRVAETRILNSLSTRDYENGQYRELRADEMEGTKYLEEPKKKCLVMYFTGPKIYTKKLRQCFYLPTAKCLHRYIQDKTN